MAGPGAYGLDLGPKNRDAETQRYDQLKVPTDWRQPESEAVDPGASSRSDLMREVQKMVTAARKADGKVRRLREEKAKKEAQWALFEKKKKAEFLEQKRNYLGDLRRISEEIEAANQQGQEASAEVQELVARGVRPKDVPMEESEDWEALLANAEAGGESDFLRDAISAATRARARQQHNPPAEDGRFLNPVDAARVLAATLGTLPQGFNMGQLGFSSGVGHGEAPMPSTATQAPVMPPPATGPPPGLGNTMPPSTYNAMSPNTRTARTAPYPPASPPSGAPVVEPGTEQGERRVPPPQILHPGQRDLSQPRVPTGVEPPRPGVKPATKTAPERPPTGSLDFQTRLMEKRAKEGQGIAMQPFRVAAPAAEAGLPVNPAEPPPAETTRPIAAIQEDDEDELSSVHDPT